MDMSMWAHEQFWGSRLPDLRLRRRLVEVAARIRANPCGTLPRAVLDKAGLKGAYRLFAHEGVTHEGILRAHVEQTRARCRVGGEYLLIEDTTLLSFSQRGAIPGMGPLTNDFSQGLLAHTCLAARIEEWSAEGEPCVTLAGLFGQQCWARDIAEGTRKERKKAKRRSASNDCARESDRWGHALRETSGPPEGVQWTLVADREGDIFEVMAQCAGQRADWVIRAMHERKTQDLGMPVAEVVAESPLLGRFTVSLRARPGVAARNAQVELRALATAIRAPRDLQTRHDALSIGVVEAREIQAPEGVEPIHWLLLTSWPCQDFAQARRVVGAYACRWLIEEYHKALKSGTSIEDSQLSTAGRIEALLAIHAVVAVDLLNLKLLATARPDEALEENLIETDALLLLEAKFGKPANGWTNRTAINAIARMGGYLGRKSDGPPGWLSIWRGWLMLRMMTEGYRLAISKQTYG